MDTGVIFSKLQMAGAFLLLVDGQLAVKESSIVGMTETMLATLTSNREQIKVLLLERELLDTKPYIDDSYNMGNGVKGCLVIPTDCAPRYKNWQPGFSCILVESDDWLKTSKNLKESEKLKWKPMHLSTILKELEATEDLTKRYYPNA